MFHILIGIVGVCVIWRSVGATLTEKGYNKPFGYQLLATIAFLGPCIAAAILVGAYAVERLESPSDLFSVSFKSLRAELTFILFAPALVGGACAGVVLMWIFRFPVTGAAARRKRAAAEYNPFEDVPSPVTPKGPKPLAASEPDKSRRCPKCGFQSRWDGRKCDHCGFAKHAEPGAAPDPATSFVSRIVLGVRIAGGCRRPGR